MTTGKKVAATLVVVLLLFVLVSCFGIWIPGVEIVFYLLVGWAPFLRRVGPQIHWRWDMVWSTAAYALTLVIGAHLFLRWLHREMSSTQASAKWRWSWTLSGFCLVLLMFTAGMAAIGVAHQTGWLIRSPEPLYRRSTLAANRIKCESNLRQIGLALHLYANHHGGSLPDDFSTLILNEDLSAAVFVCPDGPEEPASGASPQEIAENLKKPEHCSYRYLGKGLSEPLDAKRVLVVESLDNHDGAGMNVVYGDATLEWLDRADAEKLLRRLGLGADSSVIEPSSRP